MATFDEVPGTYFESYDNINVHNLMLRDRSRVNKYREAILNSKNIFKDKIVLDVGSGTGLLSLFSAQAGAKHVYAIEACKGIYELSEAIVSANKLDDKITILNGEVEKIELPDIVDKVDIIVSEWMGFYLLHESMLNSVIYARDKWLKPEGYMYPSIAYLYVCPVDMSKYLNDNLSYWMNYHDLNYEPMCKVYQQVLLEKPVIEEIKQDQLIDEEKILESFDLKTIGLDELVTIQAFNLEFLANKNSNLHGFAFWFDVVFDTDADIVTLSTGPNHEQTHWKQTIALLPEAIYSFINNNNNDEKKTLFLNENDKFECFVLLNQSVENKRNYQIDIGINLGNENQDEQNEDEEDYEDDGEEHPMPCDCSRLKCILIKATLEKYENENNQ